MDESYSLENVSSTGSNDMLWEAIKMDLDQNRVYQKEQIQSLKEQSLRITERPRIRKVGKYRLKLKQIAKKKAFKLALQTLKTLLTTKPKRSRKFRPHCTDNYTSTMNFKVSLDEDKSGNAAHLEPTGTCDETATKNLKNDGKVDKGLQTANIISEDKFSQTPVDVSLMPKRHALESIMSYIPLHLSPVLVCCGHIGKVPTCCSSHCQLSSSTKCEITAGQKHLRAETEISAQAKTNNDIETVTSQYPLKEICQELLAQLSSQGTAALQTKGSGDDNNNSSSKMNFVAKNTTSTSVDAMHSVSSLPEPPLNLRVDDKILCSNVELLTAAVTGLNPHSEYVITQPSLSTLNDAHRVGTLEEAPQTVPSPAITGQIVTPDIVRDSDNHYCLKPKEQDLVLFSKKEKMRITHFKHMPLNSELNLEAPKNDQQAPQRSDQQAGLCENKNVQKGDAVQTVDNSTAEKKSHGATEEVVLSEVESVGKEPVRSSTEPHPVLSNTCDLSAKIIQNSLCAETSAVNAKDKSEQVVEKTVNSDKLHSTKTTKENEIDSDPAQENIGARVVTTEVTSNNESKRSKILSKIRKMDLSYMSREELQSSPAFEEVDPDEMETLLLIWRQQEQLHKDPNNPDKEPTPSSPGNIFRKVKKPQELPPELRSTHTSESPSITENLAPASSALEILDNEVNTNDVSEDDDVPEASPHCEISPPKKRRLRLSLNPPKLVIQKHKDNILQAEIDRPTATYTPNENSSEVTPVSTKEVLSGLRSSKRLKAASSQKVDEVSADQNENSKKELNDGKSKQSCNKKPSTTKTKGKKNDKSLDSSTTTSTKVAKGVNSKKNKKEPIEESKQTDISTPNEKKTLMEGEKDKNNFHEQIQERVNKLKRKWLQDKPEDEVDVVGMNSSSEAESQPIPDSQKTVDSEDSSASQSKTGEIRAVSVPDLARAHDLATHILLNPWRGINARRVTRGFVCPSYESKVVTRALWDLRSNAEIGTVVERILALGWKGYHPGAVRALVAMFTLSFSRCVPFVIDGMKGEEEDTVSLSSDADASSKKKSIPVRLAATKQIFKGECIEGLHGLLRKTSDKEKETLRSWNFLKFEDRRDYVLLGPLAYLKRDESNFNTQAVFLRRDLLAVKAVRHILSGETLLVSFKDIERKLLKQV